MTSEVLNQVQLGHLRIYYAVCLMTDVIPKVTHHRNIYWQITCQTQTFVKQLELQKLQCKILIKRHLCSYNCQSRRLRFTGRIQLEVHLQLLLYRKVRCLTHVWRKQLMPATTTTAVEIGECKVELVKALYKRAIYSQLQPNNLQFGLLRICYEMYM